MQLEELGRAHQSEAKPKFQTFDDESLVAASSRRATEKLSKMQKRADSVIFADNLLIAADLKDKIKGYTDKQDKRLDIEFKKWESLVSCDQWKNWTSHSACEWK